MGFKQRIEECIEMEDFTLWVKKQSGQSQVNFCPFCGFAAAIKIGKKPHKHITATPSKFGERIENDIRAGRVSLAAAEALRNTVDRYWEDCVLNNPHIKSLHGGDMNPDILEDRITLLHVVFQAKKEK
jgi:hypothetical protein